MGQENEYVAGYTNADDSAEATVGEPGTTLDHPEWPDGWAPAKVEAHLLQHPISRGSFYHRGNAYESDIDKESIL